MCGVAVAQAVGRNMFANPGSANGITNGPLRRPTIHRQIGAAGLLAWKEPFFMAVRYPELAEQLTGGFRQPSVTVFLALAMTNMDTVVLTINITDLQVECFADSQTHGVHDKAQHRVPGFVDMGKQAVDFPGR